MTVRPACPNWYGRLELTQQQPTSKPTPAQSLWMILHEEWFDIHKIAGDPTLYKEVMEFRAHVEHAFPDAISFDLLPMIFIRCSESDVRSLAQLRRFKYALPQTVAVEDYLPILRGINALRSETGHQVYEWPKFVENGGKLPDETYVGGIMPEGSYPPPLNPDRIIADASLHRSAPPAWMPVINFSVGPFLPDSPANPVLFALQAAVNTHLIVVAAGNEGMIPNRSSLNQWAPPGALVVGASADDEGAALADYSSRGVSVEEGSRPDVVAFGASAFGSAQGTSFAAPRAAKIGCLAAAACFQVARVLDEFRGHRVGIPLVGWGMIDAGGKKRMLPGRDASAALPFAGVCEQVLMDAFCEAEKASGKFEFFVNGGLLRSMIVKSARPMPGYGVHEAGAGFVSESIFLDWLGQQSVQEFLAPFGPVDKIPASIRQAKPFHRDGLDDLADVVRRSRPTWFFDYERHEFGVNRTQAEGELSLPIGGRCIPHALMVAASDSIQAP
jgi:hypothetical protein